MNIGIIVYSISGHTLSVAAKLGEKLSAAGHAVTLERLETEVPSCRLKSVRQMSKYTLL